MHFRVFTFVFVFLSIRVLSIVASPLSPPTNIAVNGLDGRQLVDIAEIIVEVIDGLIKNINSYREDALAAQRDFTTRTMASLERRYPQKNRLIFHNQDSITRLSPDAVHRHQELDLGLGFTKGYEIWVFDSGTFSLVGDGGFENWGYGGCVSRQDYDLTFTKC
jgi:hypothetical protein